MNERIEQILLQVASRSGEGGEYLPSLHTPQDIERFAELIVEECITIVELSDPSDKPIGHEPYLTIVYNIEEHFYGVEE